MMALNLLTIRNLRNIVDITAELGPRLNFISGPNGSGKTSILEAIYFLGRGRSFRSNYSNRIIRNSTDSLTLFGKSNDQHQYNSLGIQIKDSRFRAKLNGHFLKKSSDMALVMPLLLISPDADKLLKGSPRQRRRFLDWGLFHVEQSFLDIWKRYNHILSQRNAALRQGKAIISTWDIQLIAVAEQLDHQRRDYVMQLSLVAKRHLKELVDLDNVEFRYHSGWNKEQTFSESLNIHLDSDIKSGFTQRGPHRADLVMLVDGMSAAEYLSGGQQKLAACALFLAQAHLYSCTLNKPCILLVDDLAAELDSKHRNALLQLLHSTKGQVFITTTDLSTLDVSSYENSRVFHVEHGCLVQ